MPQSSDLTSKDEESDPSNESVAQKSRARAQSRADANVIDRSEQHVDDTAVEEK